ncbi:hypothetical protein QJQ45_018107 [Haematococcus lacustris]|nr:hypothetical protein QJQ45_018107 [Haematococcus lacustris]
MRQALLLLALVWGLLRCEAFTWQDCSVSQQRTLCTLGPGETWTPTPRNVSGILTITGLPGLPASTLDLSLLGRTSLGPGRCSRRRPELAEPGSSPNVATAPLSYLVPVNLTGPGAPSITYTNVTLRLPSSCTSLAQYASLLCRGTVNASMVINRGGVGYRTWATAAVSARNLNLTCGRSLPPFNLMCSSTPVAGPEELLAALAAAGGMDEGTTSFVHVLTNISLQGYVPAAARDCSDAGRLATITNRLVVAGVPTPDNPRPELDWGAWCNIVTAYAANSQVVFYNLTHANMPLGEAASLPLSLFTALGFMVQSMRTGLGLGLLKLDLRDCTLLIPSDEANLSASSLVKELRPLRQTFLWSNVQLVSVEAQLPSAPLLVHDTGALRLNGLGASLFKMGQVVDSVVELVAINLVPWIQRPWRIAQLKYSVRAALPEVMTANLTMRGRVVFTGHPALPQTLMMDLAGAPSLLALDGPDTQLTLSNLVLANAAPLLSSLVCGVVAQQQGVACTNPDSAPGGSNTSSPEASSRAVWRATGLPDLTAVSPLPPLCTPELADALGGLTSLLWFFATPRTSPSDQPPLASAPLVLVNVTLLLPDLELRAIREVAQGGSTRVNLRPDTLDLLRAQLAGQQDAGDSEASVEFHCNRCVTAVFTEKVQKFGIRGLDVTLGAYTRTNSWGQPWVQNDGSVIPQSTITGLTTVVQPDGPLLLPLPLPPPPAPALAPPPPRPEYPAADQPHPAPAGQHSRPPTLSPAPHDSSTSPTAPAPSPSPSFSLSAGSHSSNTSSVVGAAVGAATAILLLCCVAVMWLRARAAASLYKYRAGLSSAADPTNVPWPALPPASSDPLPGGWSHSSSKGGSSHTSLLPHCSAADWAVGLVLMASAADQPVGHPPGFAAPTPGGEPGEEGCIHQSTAGSTAHTAAAVEAKSAALPAAAPSIHCSSLSVVLGQAEVEQELRLGTRLGAGTFGTVFQGTWRGMQELYVQVAVKRLVFSGLAGDLRITGQRQQVLREAELNTRLAHPHLVATYAYYLTTLDTSSSSSQASPMLPGWPSQGQGVTDHALYLVSELCEHGSLLQAIEIRRLWDEQHQLPQLGQILTMLRDIAEAMAYLHSCNILHRDLKPDNVLLQTTPQGVVAKVRATARKRDPTATAAACQTSLCSACSWCADPCCQPTLSSLAFSQVADLGLGAIMRGGHSHLSGERVGTRLYSAPEVLQGRTSPAGDVYSFGVLAWELLHGCTAWARLLQITQEPQHLQSLAPHPHLFDHDWRPQPDPAAAARAQPVVKGLRDLVDCCLQRQPNTRPSFKELLPWLALLLQLHQQNDLTVVTDIAVPRATAPLSYLVPVNLTGPGAPSITYTNVTLRLPSSCTSLAQYASLLCRGTVNASMVINRGGVGYRTWATAAVSARNLNLTCGRSLPSSFNLMCSSAPVAGPEELLAALAAAGGMDDGSISFVHVLTNISLQGYVPAAARDCSDAGRLATITNRLVVAGVPTPDNPRPELDWGAWCNIVSAYAANSQVVFYNLTHANMPLGEAASLPLSLFTALGFMVQSLRIGLGLGLLKLEFRDCTLLIPNDEGGFHAAPGLDGMALKEVIIARLLVPANLSASSLVKELRPRRQGFMWTDVQLVSVEAQLPSAPLLVHDTGVLRLNGLGASLFRMGQVVDSVTMRGRVVFTGHPALPQTLMMDLAAAPSLLALDGPDTQLTLSNLVLANAAPLLSSLTCGAVAQQQGVACTPPDSAPGASNTSSPEASSRAVWRATGLPDLTAVSPLLPLCTPELADALGGLTSLLWFFATPRTSPSDQPPLASAPLVLVNVTLLLPDLELRAIREVAQGGSTRVNLRPDTLDLLRAQLAGQQVLPAAWPPGGLTFPSFSWFGLRGLDVTLGAYTPTNSWGQPWVQNDGSVIPQSTITGLTTAVIPDGPLLLPLPLPPPPAPALAPPPPRPEYTAADQPHPAPAGQHSRPPTLSPAPHDSSTSPTAPAPSPSPSFSLSAGSHSSNTSSVVGAAVGAATAILLLCCVAVTWLRARAAASFSKHSAGLSGAADSTNAPWPALPPASSNPLPGGWSHSSSKGGSNHTLLLPQRNAAQGAVGLVLMPSAAAKPVGHPPGCAAPTPGGEPGEEGCINQSTAGSTAHTAAAVEAKSAALPAAAPSVHCSSLNVVLGQAEVEQELSLGTRLGAGTFGTVFQGTWRGMQELCVQVAVKRLVFSGLAGDLHITGQRQQVLREAELNTRLAHPHLVATYAYYLTTLDTSSSNSQASPMLPAWPSQGQGVTNHALYLVSELCEHGSLLQAIGAGRLWDEQRQLPQLGQILTMLRDIAGAMDLKPDNVLLQTTPQGVVAKVADLGLGAIMRAEHSHLSGERVGTRLYSAPEVLQGRTSPAGDVYSFGVLAWELLHGCTAWARLLQITQEPQHLQSLAPHPHLFDHDWRPQPDPAAAARAQPVVKGLRDLVDCCLQRQPNTRPSFKELLPWLALLLQLHQQNKDSVPCPCLSFLHVPNVPAMCSMRIKRDRSKALLLLALVWGLLRCEAFTWQDCSVSQQRTLCTLGPGETWTPTPRNVSGILTITGFPGLPASTLDLSLLGRTSLGPGRCSRRRPELAEPGSSPNVATAPLSYLVPVNLTGPGAPSITYTNVTLRLPSSCTSLAQYASLLCRGTVNASMVINRGGVGYRTWATAAVSARNLNLTCGRSLPPSFNLMCSSAPVAGPEELLEALATAGGMDEGTTSFVHVLTNISLQGYVPAAARDCSDAGRLATITNRLVVAGVPTPDNPRPELDWGAWCSIVTAYAANSQVVFYNLTHANMPLGEAASLPLSLFTALGFMVQSLRNGLGLGLPKLDLRDCTLLIPNDEANLTLSPLVKELRPSRLTFLWSNVQLVSVEAQPPSAPLLVHDTGALRLNGLGASLFKMGQVVDPVVALTALNLVPRVQRPWRIAQLKYSVRAALPEVMTANLVSSALNMAGVGGATKAGTDGRTMRGRVVFTGHPALPQTLMMDLAAAPSLLALDGPDTQLTLSNLVLANAAPLLSSLTCGVVAQQQGVACTPPDSAPGASNTSSPEASSRAVWRATGLPDLTAVSPLLPLCTPELADALGGLTSLLWFFATPRTSPSEQPPLASAPLVLVNVTLLLPDLELRAIREVAQGGSTRVNLRPDTLDLLHAQLAGQQVLPAAWPPGGLTFPSFSWRSRDVYGRGDEDESISFRVMPKTNAFIRFGLRGLDVTLGAYTPTNSWGQPWVQDDGSVIPQSTITGLTTVVLPDGPLLLPLPLPPPPAPEPDPPPPRPEYPAADQPHPAPAGQHSRPPTLSPAPQDSSISPTALAQPPSPSFSLSAGSHSSNTSSVVGAAVGAATAILLLCCVAVTWLRARAAASLCIHSAGMSGAANPTNAPWPALPQTSFEPLPCGWSHSSSKGGSNHTLLLPQRNAAQGAVGLVLMPSAAAKPVGHPPGCAAPTPGGEPGEEGCIDQSTAGSTAHTPAAVEAKSAALPAAAPSVHGSSLSVVLGQAEVEQELSLGTRLGAGTFGTVFQGTWRGMQVRGPAGLDATPLHWTCHLARLAASLSALPPLVHGQELCVQVAVKRLVFSGLAGDLHITGQRQQVLREAELNTRLAHPHLVATYAYYLTTLDTSSSSQASPMLPGWPSQMGVTLIHSCCCHPWSLLTCSLGWLPAARCRPLQGQGVTDHALYLVSELCEHGSLFQAIETRRLWDEQHQLPHLGLILTMLRDIAEAMAYLHSCNILHRDLKPDNVLLQTTPQGVVAKVSATARKTRMLLVADLGLGAIMRAGHSHLSGERVGTRLYSAPEVLQDRTSPAGDVYSFGVLAWELLHGCTAWARLLQITQEPQHLQSLAPHPHLFDHDWRPQPDPAAAARAQPVVKGLRDLVDCCLQRQPNTRPSFKELLHWLALLLQLHQQNDTARISKPALALVHREKGGFELCTGASQRLRRVI